MMPFLPFGNPWGYRFQGAFGNSIQSTREVDQRAVFLYLWKHILSDFQADIVSLNSAKRLNNLIPVRYPKPIQYSAGKNYTHLSQISWIYVTYRKQRIGT